MADGLTKSAARNIFYGGSLFFFLLFAALTAHSHWYMVNKSTDKEGLTESVEHGKHIWEKNMCINCHSIMGEGAYFAPELGNVFVRRGGEEAFKPFLHAWMKAQPLGAPGRRAMPQFNLTEQQVDDMAEFLKWTSKIDTNNWPPNKEG